MFTYPIELAAAEEGGFIVTLPDLPFGITEADDEEEARERAADLLETVIIALMDDRAEIPAPSRPKRGQRAVTLPALSAAKVALYQAMRAAGVRKAELGRRMGLHMPQIDRLLDLRHASRLDQVEAALRALGKELRIELADAA